MNRENWQKVKAIFDLAVEVAPNARSAFLNNACADDRELRREVETLLASSDEAESFMENPFVGEIVERIIGKPTNQLKNGQVFSHYKIVRQIGAGGMGEVYLAEDKKLDRRVAIKILYEKFAKHESNLQRFTQEAKTASGLNHPNILVIHEIGEAEDSHYIVSEFIEGKTLREIISNPPMKLSEVLDISIQIVNALTAAHAVHIVHRDIKPENIMIRPDGFVKILDFGLAKLVGQKAVGLEDAAVKQNQTAKGIILGTVKYMSPEQAKGERVDERTDIFSLGVVIYEMIAGRTPFAGNSVSETFANLINAEPQLLSHFAANVPNELQRTVSKMLRKNKDERYQTMKGLLADLKNLRENLAFDKRLEKPHPPDAENATAILQVTTGGANLQTAGKNDNFTRQIRRHKPLAAVALIVLLAAIGFGVWYFTNFSANTTQIKSIAVLPLKSFAAKNEDEELRLRITDALITKLGNLNEISVRPTNSVLRFIGEGQDAVEIGKKLEVDAVLDGRVQTENNRLRVTLQLISVTTGEQIWSEQFDGNTGEILALQDMVASRLRQKFAFVETEKFNRRPTENKEAYEAYLKGRYFWNQRTPDSYFKAIRFFEEAIGFDPNFALAYSGVADSYVLLNRRYVASSEEALPKAEEAARKALELDDMLAEAHNSMGLVKSVYNRNWRESENHFRRAIELNPNYAIAYGWYGMNLSTQKRFEEAEMQLRKAEQLDPTSRNIAVYLTVNYYHWRQFDRAIEQSRKALELDPKLGTAYIFLSQSLEQKKMFDQAVEAHLERQKITAPQDVEPLREAFLNSGIKGFWRKQIEVLREQAVKNSSCTFEIATRYALLDEKIEALKIIEDSSLDGGTCWNGINVEPAFDSLRSEPRFQEVLRKMNLQ